MNKGKDLLSLSFAVTSIIKMIFVIKLRLHEREALVSDNLALLLIFFNLLYWNLSKCSQFVKIVLPII